jgi:hypothetical protein
MAQRIEVREAERPDAPDIAEIHLAARRGAMPYLHQPHTDQETRDRFARVVGDGTTRAAAKLSKVPLAQEPTNACWIGTPGGPGDRDGIADHCVRQCNQRSDIVEVHWRNYAIRGQLNDAV